MQQPNLPGRLAGKRVLITGTAGGQGQAAQQLFAREGARVCGCDIRSGGAVDTAAILSREGFEVYGSEVDLSDAVAARNWIEESAKTLGGIDVLYNNAAGFGFAPFSQMDLSLWRHVMKVELDILFHTTSPAWRWLCEGGGSVINTASLGAILGIGPLGSVAHSTAKGGVVAMTKALAAEGAEFGVRVNAISPGFVSTPATDAVVDGELRAWQLSRHLLQRPGTGLDVAGAALYLASDESSWVTGQNLSVDGGATAGWRNDTETRRIQTLAAGAKVETR
ncbi:SDR family NAD(P)-dependent oxidoreductase [Nocardia carnea]|uniref:SDR family NAD(P)-dependent oxidoreductase n=1 Tax=Nocardia carnea TaxID=37328 RepID=UPI0002F1E37F|nr:SDR family NAD(P)-dependent oxidoreductase [Nocardia carnea]